MTDISIYNPKVVAYLTDNFLSMTNPEMGQALGVSTGSVTGMLQRLGLRRPFRNSMVDAIEGEIWKDCSRHPGYRVSNLGRIAKGNMLLIQTMNGCGYMQVKMVTSSGERKSERVHRIVAEELIPNPLNAREVNHKDGRKVNNALSNLEWCSGQENVRHAVANGLVKRRRGSEHHQAVADHVIHEICRKLVEGKDTQHGIARAVGVHPSTVHKVAYKHTRTEISDLYFKTNVQRPAGRRSA